MTICSSLAGLARHLDRLRPNGLRHAHARRIPAIALVSALLVPNHGHAQIEPADFVRSVGNNMVTLYATADLSPDERARQFKRLLVETLDFPRISRFVLGKHWRQASEEQRREFRNLFENYVILRYARQAANYGGEYFVVERSKESSSGVSVKSRLERPSGAPIRVDWRLRPSDDGWRIVDLVVEGVSIVMTHRSEFDSVIATNGGIDGLLGKLRDVCGALDPSSPLLC